MKSINVVIITYKQEQYIGRAIDSVLSEREYGLQRIIIIDDNSPDNNWGVILSFKDKYPDLIEAYRNSKNLGPYGNFNKGIELRGDADLYYIMAGDDAICNGFFLKAQDLLKTNSKTGKYIVSGDWCTIDNSGGKTIGINRPVDDNYLSQYLRSIISPRSTLISRDSIACFKKVPIDCSLMLSEALFDAQFFMYADCCLYLNHVCSVYYSKIGISTQLSRKESDYRTIQAMDTALFFIDNIITEQKDINYMQSLYWLAQCRMTHSAIPAAKSLYYRIRGFKLRYCSLLRIYFYLGSLIKALVNNR